MDNHFVTLWNAAETIRERILDRMELEGFEAPDVRIKETRYSYKRTSKFTFVAWSGRRLETVELAVDVLDDNLKELEQFALSCAEIMVAKLWANKC